MDECKASIQKLNNTNYSTWSYKLELILRKEDLWNIVTEERPDHIDEKEWSAKEMDSRNFERIEPVC